MDESLEIDINMSRTLNYKQVPRPEMMQRLLSLNIDLKFKNKLLETLSYS